MAVPAHRFRRVAGALLAIVLLAGACGDGDDGANDASASTTAPPPTAAPTTTAPPSTAAPTTTAGPPTSAAPAAGEPATAVDCASVPTGLTELVVDAGGAEHDVRVYVPTTVDGSSRLALVLNFHGFSSNGMQQAALSDYEEFAEDEGFVVAHPTGVPATRDTRNSWELADFDDPGKDDLAFANELLDLLVEDYCVDESRVYATGMSGGGMFTSRLVCDMSDRIAAASSVAAIQFSETCSPERAVPFMAIHGTEDQVVPFDGDASSSRLAGEDFAEALLSQPIPEEFARFAETMGCDPAGERVQQSNDIFATTYTGCDDDVPLVFYEVVEGGHTWPGTPLAEQLTEFQGYITTEIDATADSWAFFEQHTLER